METKELFQEFLEWKELKELSPLTLRSYRGILERLTAVLPPDADEITFKTLKDYFLARQVSVKTRRNEIGLIKHVFTFAVQAGYMAGNPAVLLPLPKYKRKPPPHLTKAEYERVLYLAANPACPGAVREWYAVRNVAIVSMLVGAGLRAAELCALRRRDVDLTQRVAQVWAGKGDNYRDVALTARTCGAVGAHWDKQKVGKHAIENYDGLPTSYNGVYKLMKRLGGRAGIDLYPHLLRHTYATLSIENGADVVYVSEQLGHEQLETTMIYVHPGLPDRIAKHQRYSPLGEG